MSSLPRMALVIGSLVASISFAEAGSRSALETYPILSTKVDKVAVDSAAPAPPPVPAAQPPVKSGPDARQNRRSRRSRLAARDTKANALAPMPQRAAPSASSPAATAQAAPGVQAADPKTPPAAPAADHPGLQPGQEQPAKTPTEVRTATESPRESAAPTLAALIAKHAHENGIPVGLAQAVVRIESRGNIRASHGGALGLMQIKAGTARAAGFSGGAAGLLDAETNLHFGMKVLADAYRDAGGDVCRTLMKYQSGHLATHMTRANRTYCSKARAVMAGA